MMDGTILGSKGIPGDRRIWGEIMTVKKQNYGLKLAST
jgi:hypothetical protein